MEPQRKRILIVDDSKTALLMEQIILQKNSYEVVVASDGAEGVAKALAEHPDLILLDVVMPKMNGFETLRVLRQQDTTRTIPVIMVTTRGEAENVEAGYAAGCSDYLTKPVDATALLAKVGNCLGE
jgi:DNA-binding response OmpR family regulator